MPATTFDPSRDGFAFANSWTLSAAQRDELRQNLAQGIERALTLIAPPFPGSFLLLRLAPRMASSVARGWPDGYGLCGGMAFAALDHWRQGGTGLAARFTERPPVGSELHRYLWRRLIDSLALNVHTFLAWMAVLHLIPAWAPFQGGAPWLLARSREEWSRLRERLDAGQPVPLGLVGETKDPFSDHQVLAYGYESTDPEHGRIFVYDMNCPGGRRTIEIDLTGPFLRAQEDCAGGRGALRGFFCETYVPASPPVG